MTTELIRSTIFDYFQTNFTAAEIEFENLHTIDMSTRSAPFVDLSLRFTGNTQISLGSNARTRQRGAVQVDIYIKDGKGTKPAYIIGDTIQALFKLVTIGGIVFAVPSTLTPITHLGWHRLTIRCPFYLDA